MPKRGSAEKEKHIQAAFFQHIEVMVMSRFRQLGPSTAADKHHYYTCAEGTFHSPNGFYAFGRIGYANHMKQQGVKSGVPDVLCLVPSGQWNGLAIELKRKGGTVSDSQKFWLGLLERECGYLCRVCYSVDEAVSTWIDYIKERGNERRRRVSGIENKDSALSDVTAKGGCAPGAKCPCSGKPKDGRDDGGRGAPKVEQGGDS